MYLLAPFQAQPSLSTQIQKAHQFASKAGRVVSTQAAQGLQIPSYSVEASFIQTEDVGSKGGKRCGYRPRTSLGQPCIDHFPHFL
jgi:hypothetical protein